MPSSFLAVAFFSSLLGGTMVKSIQNDVP